MKIVISESRLESLIKRFLIYILGTYVEEESINRMGHGYKGSFYNSSGDMTGEVYRVTLRIDVDIHNLMLDMFNIKRNTLDQCIIETVNEIIHNGIVDKVKTVIHYNKI